MPTATPERLVNIGFTPASHATLNLTEYFAVGFQRGHVVVRTFSVITTLLMAASLSACATVTRGRTTTWSVSTMPVGAVVETSAGVSCNATPCSITMPRLSQFTATISKPGYKSVSIDVSHHLSAAGGAAFLGNAIFGGLIGATIDVVTGATQDLKPNDQTMTLQQDGFADWSGGGSLTPMEHLAANYDHSSPAPYMRFSGARPGAEGRVVEVKVLPDGSIREIRETP